MKEVMWDGKYTYYMLIKRSNTILRLGMLHVNNLFQNEAKFEVLEGLSVFDIVLIKIEKHWVCKYLLGLKIDNVRLFIAMEQGGGKHSKNVIVIVSPKAKMSVRK